MTVARSKIGAVTGASGWLSAAADQASGHDLPDHPLAAAATTNPSTANGRLMIVNPYDSPEIYSPITVL